MIKLKTQKKIIQGRDKKKSLMQESTQNLKNKSHNANEEKASSNQSMKKIKLKLETLTNFLLLVECIVRR